MKYQFFANSIALAATLSLLSPAIVRAAQTSIDLPAVDLPTVNPLKTAEKVVDLQAVPKAQPTKDITQSTSAESTIASPLLAQTTRSGIEKAANPNHTQPVENPALQPTKPQLLAQTPTAIDQVTSVSQLSDVRPTDWAFQALQSLVERYGCIAGYPDRTYRGNRALTRYEFAAGLNACLDRVNELIAASTADLVKKEDLATLQRLQQEFSVELATIRGRVDALEARTATLESQQFSTTTKLQGEVIFGLISPIQGDNVVTGQEVEKNPTLGYRVRLNLNTSFSGRDLLTTRLQANNVTPLGATRFDPTSPTGVVGSGTLGTNMGRIEFDGDSRNQVSLSLLRYRFPISANTNVYLAGTGNGFVDLDASSQLNPYFDGGAVSLFALRNPIYNYSGGAGIGIRHQFGTAGELNLAYLTSVANNPADKNGLTDGQYGALAQFILNLGTSSRIGFTYINAYTPFDTLTPGNEFNLTATGSNLSNSNFGVPVNVNAYGISGTFQLSPKFALGGWVGYANHRYVGRGDGDVWNWAVTLAFPDLLKQGNLGGILVGQQPKLTSSSGGIGQRDRDTSLHLEAFYRHRLNDNISITPGVIWVTNPEFNEANEDTVIGVVRTVFSF
ncbi:iron uptake porin [Phormidesmis sp. 146-12]